MPRPQRPSIISGGVLSTLGFALMHAVTLPYYRFFRQNTLLPIQAIAKALSVRKDEDEIHSMLARWRARKLYELHFIQIAVRRDPISRRAVATMLLPCQKRELIADEN